MKIIAAFAPSQDVRDRFFSTTPTSLGWALAPLISAIDAGLIEGVEYVSKIYDPLRVYPGIWNDCRTLFEDERPDILLLSSTYDSHNSARIIAATARRVNPDILIIYGGPHVNEVASPKVVAAMPQIYPFNENGNPFDILIRGNAELVLVQLVQECARLGAAAILPRFLTTLEARQRFASVPGRFEIHVSGRGLDRTIIASSGIVLDLSSLPVMPRKMFGNNLDLYGFSCFRSSDGNGRGKLLPSVSTLLHRGCKSYCIFCSERGNYEERDLDHIAAELDGLVRDGIKGVFFDDSTLGDHEGFDEILMVLKSFPLQYGSLNRFDELSDPKRVELLAESGFVYQYCSVEQFDDVVLKSSAKGQRIDQIRMGVDNLERSGIRLGTSLLFGLPSETISSIDRTIDFISSVDDRGILDCLSTSLYSFHPNTPLTLGTNEGKQMHPILKYDCEPPNLGSPWDSFEEGQWYHPSWVTLDRVVFVEERVQHRLGHRMVRNMRKDGVSLTEIRQG